MDSYLYFKKTNIRFSFFYLSFSVFWLILPTDRELRGIFLLNLNIYNYIWARLLLGLGSEFKFSLGKHPTFGWWLCLSSLNFFYLKKSCWESHEKSPFPQCFWCFLSKKSYENRIFLSISVPSYKFPSKKKKLWNFLSSMLQGLIDRQVWLP